jgi:hypothetical protein
MLSILKTFIPQFHAFSDSDGRYNMGATWTDQAGLQDYHNVQVMYVHNSEALALQGDPQPDGSFKYTEPNGRVHVMEAERVTKFMEHTTKQATVMASMLDKLDQYKMCGKTLDTTAQAG